MFWTNTKRVMKGGFLNFWRNGVVSLSSILVMIVALFMVGSTILMSAFLESSLNELKAKVDVNVYMVPSTPEDEILNLKKTLEALPEVASIEYVSEPDVLAAFQSRHQDDALTLRALDEIGTNPFGATLNVKAKDPGQYGAIADFLKGGSGGLSSSDNSIIARTNYNDNKIAINKLSSLIAGVERVGLVIVATLILISILITFNTIRLAIYTAREEINVMRLVGARNAYIRLPFVMEGILYGLVAALVSMGLFYPITLWLKASTSSIYNGINLFQYYVNNFAQIFLIILVTGVLLGAISSFLAVRKYLKA